MNLTMAEQMYGTSERAWDAGDEEAHGLLSKAELAAPAPAISRTDALRRKADGLRAIRLDMGLTAAQAAELAAIESELFAPVVKDRSAADAAFAATWTAEVYAERKARWNAALAQKNAKWFARNGSILQEVLEEAMGFRFAQLKAAGALHKKGA